MFGKNILKRLLAAITVGAGLNAAAIAEDQFALGSSTFAVPAGWKETKKEDDRLTFTAPDGRQQATVSLMRFNWVPSFEDFKEMCSLRYKAEKKGAPDVLLQPDIPSAVENAGKFSLNFSGEEKATDRIFSGFLSLQGKELITIYVEGIGVDSISHLDSFKTFISSLKRK